MVEIEIDGHKLRLTRAHYDNFVRRLSRRALVKFYRSLIFGTESTVTLSEKYGLSRERICQLYNNYAQPVTGHDIWWRRKNMVRPRRIGKMPPVIAEIAERCREQGLTCEPIKTKDYLTYLQMAVLIESRRCVISVTNRPYKAQYADRKYPKYWHCNPYRDADFHLFKVPDGWYVIDRATINKHSPSLFIPIVGVENKRRGPTPKTDWREYREAWHIIKKEVDREEKRAEGNRDAGDGASDGGSADGADAVDAGEIQGAGRPGAPA